MDPSHAALVIPDGSELSATLHRLAASYRMVFFAGLPGTGKSLLGHQLAHMAHALGRTVHLLQWDVARPVFEASAAGQRYLLVDGVTHGAIRKAVGLWARRALVTWAGRHPGAEPLLIGETPFVGGRLIELACPRDDLAEPLLAAASARFVIPVPSVEVRAFLEAERVRRTAAPRHPREREDAPPGVLRDLWRQLVDVAAHLGVGPPAPPGSGDAPYDPVLYRRTYERLLVHRRAESIPVDRVLPTAALSVYDLAVPHAEVVPTAAEADATIHEIEARYPAPETLQQEIRRWWAVDGDGVAPPG